MHVKPPPELIERFGVILERFPNTERRKMFGYPAAFVGGNLAAGLFGDRWVVRLPRGDVDDLVRAGARLFEPTVGRVWKDYIEIPADVIADDAALSALIARAIENAHRLPPKT